MLRTLAIAAVAAALAACGSTKSTDLPKECDGKALTHAVTEGGLHTTNCEDNCGNGLNPPTAGLHCLDPAPCRASFDPPINQCRWVHNLEHGHVVLLYNCPEGCPEIVDRLTTIWRDSGFDKRMLVTPWEPLKTKVAAVVWGWSWTGDEIDEDAIKCIVGLQDRDAPEKGVACLP